MPRCVVFTSIHACASSVQFNPWVSNLISSIPLTLSKRIITYFMHSLCMHFQLVPTIHRVWAYSHKIHTRYKLHVSFFIIHLIDKLIYLRLAIFFFSFRFTQPALFNFILIFNDHGNIAIAFAQRTDFFIRHITLVVLPCFLVKPSLDSFS